MSPMRTLTLAILLIACGMAQAAAPDQAAAKERLSADTPKTTVLGNTFIAPAGWSISVRGPATIIEAPEGDSRIVLVDVRRRMPTRRSRPAGRRTSRPKWPLKVATDVPDKDGWSRQRNYSYQTSPNERRDVVAGVQFAGDVWTVVIYDMAQAVGEKRGAQVALIFDKLLPKGYSRETLRRQEGAPPRCRAHRRAHEVRRGRQKATGVPGVSFGLVQDGKVVFSGGVGVRELGGAAKVDGDTLYMIASNTKGLTTLLLAKLVDAGQDHLEDAGHAAAAAVQARQCGHDPARARRASDLRLHRLAATGHGVAVPVQGRHARKARSRRSRPCSRPASSARCSSTRTCSPAPPASPAGTCCIRSSRSAPPTTRRCRRKCSIRSA